uniref:Uncharacterized protein n=1 Tax=Dulem virus 34 TaxID=3145752 RepID=A0AAU8B809_9CAUD
MQLKTGVDFFLDMPVDDLNEIAETVNQMMEEVSRHGHKK